MNPIAQALNQNIESGNPYLMEMLSDMGKNLFFPKGILSQSAEAKEKAYKLNATIGIATEKGRTMYFPSVMDSICNIRPKASITYAPSFGIPALRKAWQDSLFTKNPLLSDKIISLPVTTCGITHAISMFADMWLDPGDVIVFPDMMWGNYNMILNVKKGAVISHYPLFTANGGFNLAAFEETLRAEAEKHDKISVMLNFPNNPTGYSVTKEEGKTSSKSLPPLPRRERMLLRLPMIHILGFSMKTGFLKNPFLQVFVINIPGCLPLSSMVLQKKTLSGV